MGHTGSVFSLAFSPDGRSLASASRDGFILLWDVAARRELLRLPGHSGLAYGVAFSPAGSVLASTGSDGAVRLWGRFSIADALARLCTQIDPAAAPRLWHELEPTIAYRRPC